MARDFPGIPFSSLPDPTAPDFTPRLRNILGTIHHWAQDQSNAMSRIANGQVPNGSGGTPDGGGVLGVTDHGLLSGLSDDDHSQYLLLAGRTGGQQVWGGTASTDALTLRPSQGDLKTRSVVVGESTTVLSRFKDTSNYVLPGGNGIAGEFDMRHTDAGTNGSTMFHLRGSTNGSTFFDIFDASLNSFGSCALSGSVASTDGVLVTTRKVAAGESACTIALKDSAIGGASDNTAVTLTVKQRASQTGVLTRWQDSGGTSVASISTAGAATVASLSATGTVSAASGTFSGVTVNGQAACEFLTAAGTSTTQVAIVAAAAAGQSVDIQQWSVGGTGVVASIGPTGVIDAANGLTSFVAAASVYDGTGLLLSDAGSGFKGQIAVVSSNLTADRIYQFPDGDGVVVLSGVTAALAGSSSSTLVSSTASTGAAFIDTTTSTKRMRFVLSGAVGNNAITVSSTAARVYTLPDTAGRVTLVGNAAASSGVLGTIALTGQTASLAAQTLLTGNTVSAGLYRVSFYIKTTTAGDAADNLTATLAWNDGGAQTEVVGFLGGGGTNSNTVPYTAHALDTNNAFSHATLVVRVAASQNITFTTTLTSPGAGTPAYTIDARIEALG